MLISFLIFLMGFTGAALCAFGAWQIYPPAGFIVAGALLMTASYLYSKAQALTQLIQLNQKGDE